MKMRYAFVVMGLGAALAAPAMADEQQIMQKAGCLACHTVDKKLIGPAFKEVSAKYKGDKAAEGKLVDKVRKGGAGVWGQVPMPPNAATVISDGDLKSVVQWILKQ
jgi:cytochrome c